MGRRSVKGTPPLVPNSELLDAFAYGTAYVPSSARSIPLAELPLRLYEVAQRCQVTGWCAWDTPGGLRFIEAAIVGGDDDSRQPAKLELMLYDVDGVLVAAGVWRRDVRGDGVCGESKTMSETPFFAHSENNSTYDTGLTAASLDCRRSKCFTHYDDEV